MTADIINLRQFRKQRLRDEKEDQADANRAKYGLTKQQREEARTKRELADKRLDQLKRGESIDIDSDDLDPGNVS
ncbi:MAG: DUF4169 family protein [Pseudomonadota bacterium]